MLNGIGKKKAFPAADDNFHYPRVVVENEEQLNELATFVRSWAQSNGLVFRAGSRENDVNRLITVPMTMLPSAFPEQLFHKAMRVQKILNELYFRISWDWDFLVNAYKEVIRSDQLMQKFVDILKCLRAEGAHQKMTLMLQRTDYLVHQERHNGEPELKQVEVNVGQIGCPGLGNRMSACHQRVADRLGLHKYGTIPENNCTHQFALALFQAWKQFDDQNALLLFVNHAELCPYSYFDQWQVRDQLELVAQREGVRLDIIELTFAQCYKRLELLDDFSLVHGPDGRRVAVVHLWIGYLPEHYPCEKSWKGRTMIERSSAILSPNIGQQLASTKKIQQLLSEPGCLEYFLPDQPESIALLRETYTNLWGGLDKSCMSSLVKDAIKFPDKYVLKAQLDDGTGVYFDNELREKLNTLSEDELAAHILMKKLRPMSVPNYLLRGANAPELCNVIPELGVFGAFLGDGRGMRALHNNVIGYTFRTKRKGQNLGGILTGGTFDSALLVRSTAGAGDGEESDEYEGECG